MDDQQYVLKKTINDSALEMLNKRINTRSHRLYWAINKLIDDEYPSDTQLDDLIAALKSGKKIVNPMSPPEKVKYLCDEVKTTEMYNGQYVVDTIKELIIQISKVHPDVADWLKEDDTHA